MSGWLRKLSPPDVPAPVFHGSESILSPVGNLPLEDLLDELARWGSVNLCQMSGSGGWYCWVDVKVNAAGVNFQVKSASNHTAPREAVTDCRDKLVTALKGLGVSA